MTGGLIQVIAHTDAARFQSAALPFLLRHEAQNNLMIGIVARLAQGANSTAVGGGGESSFWTVQNHGQTVAAAVITPPQRFILTDAPPEAPEALQALANHLRQHSVQLPGVIGPKDAADRFATLWEACCPCKARLDHSLRVYQLDLVLPPPPTPGRFHTADLSHADLYRDWGDAFCHDTGITRRTPEAARRERLATGGVLLWLDPEPVAMAIAVGQTPNGIRIGSVYTPPNLRRKGYATALTAAVSQRQLDTGKKFCFLFTDLANPTSNNIYRRIGYRPVCDFSEIDFI